MLDNTTDRHASRPSDSIQEAPIANLLERLTRILDELDMLGEEMAAIHVHPQSNTYEKPAISDDPTGPRSANRGLDSNSDSFARVFRIHFKEQVRAMNFDGARRDRKPFTDQSVRKTVGHTC